MTGVPTQPTGSTVRKTNSGAGRALVAVYGIFALAASARASVQLITKFEQGAWIALLPATAASTILRLAGVHNSHPSLSSAAELAMAVLTGFLIGRGLHAGKRPVAASMLALGTLLSVQAGPVPVANGWRSFGLFLLLAPLYAACGAMQAVFTGWLATRRPPESTRAAV